MSDFDSTLARLQTDLDQTRAALVQARGERDEARAMLIAMYEGGEALPSSIFQKAEAWRDAHPRTGRCPMCRTVHKPDPYADLEATP